MSKTNLPKEENVNIKDTILELQKYLNSSKCNDSLSSSSIMME